MNVEITTDSRMVIPGVWAQTPGGAVPRLEFHGGQLQMP